MSPKPSTEALAGERRRRTSDLLEQLAAAHDGQRIAVGDIADALGERGFGVIMLVLALPNALPGPAIPGLSAVLALPLVPLTLQMLLGRAEPRLPHWLLRRSMSAAGFRRFLNRALPSMRWLEGLLRPRPSWLVRRAGLPLLGALLLLLTLVLALPIPFANAPVAVALIIIALALLERDGLALVIGLALGLLATVWVGVLLVAGTRLAQWLFL
jgi:hypothetical protein